MAYFEIPGFSVEEKTAIAPWRPWNLELINVSSFWQKTKGDGVVVAILDTGLDVNHKEFTGRIIAPINIVDGSGDVTDNVGHGTHVAGIIAGKTTGVAPECRIMPIKISNERSITNKAIQDAFKWIVNWNKECKERDRVVAVNCSFSGPEYDPVVAFYIRQLTSDGVVVCVAAGNAGDGNPETHENYSFPAFIQEVVTVSSVNSDGSIAHYSNSFDGIDLAAPGTDIYSCAPGNRYCFLSGTSMATPHVTGACALLSAYFKKREGVYPREDDLDGSCGEREGILFKHIKPVEGSSYLYGKGLLDLTFDTKRWPLYRVQLGAYYYKEGAERKRREVAVLKGLPTYLVKY